MLQGVVVAKATVGEPPLVRCQTTSLFFGSSSSKQQVHKYAQTLATAAVGCAAAVHVRTEGRALWSCSYAITAVAVGSLGGEGERRYSARVSRDDVGMGSASGLGAAAKEGQA